MLPKPIEHALAIKLRYKGLSYSEIIRKVPVSQAVLSLWLRNIPLTIKQKERLLDLSSRAGGRARHQQRLDRMVSLKKEVEKELPQLLKNQFFMFGLALYWAEGAKIKPWRTSVRVDFANSDPLLIILMRKWLMKFSSVKGDDLQYRLHIHVTADALKAKKVLAKILGVPSRRIKVSLKKHDVQSRHKHDHYIGLISMRARRSTWLNRRIELWTKGVAETYLAQA